MLPKSSIRTIGTDMIAVTCAQCGSALLTVCVANSVGVTNVNENVIVPLLQDAEFRVRELIQESLKFARFARRGWVLTALGTVALVIIVAQPNQVC